MNNVNLLGNLTKNPELKYAGELAFAKFSLAVQRRLTKDGEQSADFINCTAFGKTAENISKYFQKGSKICVRGHIQTGRYKNNEGATVYTTDVIVDEFDFCSSRNESPATAPDPASANGFMDIPDGIDESLPFN